MFLSILLAQVQNQDPTGVTAADKIMDGAVAGSRALASSFDKDWQDLVSGNSPVYTAVVSVSLLIAAVLISFWSIGWYAEIANNGFSTKLVDEIVWPIIVVLMLTNNGAMMANTSLMFKGISFSLNDKVLNITRNGVTLREAIRETNMNQAFSQAVQAKIASCQQLPESATSPDGTRTTSPRRECIDKEIQAAKKDAEKYRSSNNLSGKNPWDLPGFLTEAANSIVQLLVFFIFSGLEAGYQILLQISFILNAYIGPIFLVLSMFRGSKPIFAWLSGWFALSLTLISYSIIVGIVASSIVNTPSTNPFLFQFISALLSPLLATAIGMGGGMSLFSTFINGASATGQMVSGMK